ncbi:hypothetical protein RQP54_17465 [Curvibacter sp. APW13]|uniref:hypothetical protein n=1 Tax=Curvibacter sp. APW13 TaxID=3077236 RepID=UPI0028DE04EA|nr:hypothetical protein [Curvibacter sp. APW13]MDT8992664.1 hypothetical protein [Curvibacter sp. APW13]
MTLQNISNRNKAGMNHSTHMNTLIGTNTTDRMRGFGGNEYLYGGGGDDTLDGGSGQNLLLGAQGDDTYVVHTADALAQTDAQTGELRLGTMIDDAQGGTCRRKHCNTPKYIANYSMNMPGYCRFGLQTKSSNDTKWGVAA